MTDVTATFHIHADGDFADVVRVLAVVVRLIDGEPGVRLDGIWLSPDRDDGDDPDHDPTAGGPPGVATVPQTWYDEP